MSRVHIESRVGVPVEIVKVTGMCSVCGTLWCFEVEMPESDRMTPEALAMRAAQLAGMVCCDAKAWQMSDLVKAEVDP